MQTLKGKVAIVTGGGSGLGESTALAFARVGVNVAIFDISEDRAERTVEQTRSANVEGMSRLVDVSSFQQVQQGVEAVVDRFGRIDFLVNCAGIDYTLSVEDLDAEKWAQVIGVNLSGTFYCAKAAFPHLKKQGGHIVNISSTAGKRGWSNATAYCASKFGIVGLTQALAAEGKPYDIKVSLVAPGGMRTRFFDRLEEKPDPSNLNDPRNVADLIVFMVSQPSESIINEVIVCSINETSWP